MIETHPRFKPYGFPIDHKDPATVGRLWDLLVECAGKDIAFGFMACQEFAGAPLMVWVTNHTNKANKTVEGSCFGECLEKCILWCWDESHIDPPQPLPKVKEKKVGDTKKETKRVVPVTGTQAESPTPAFKPLPPPKALPVHKPLPKPEEVLRPQETILDMFT